MFFLFLFLFFLWNFPWLTRYYRPTIFRVDAQCSRVLVVSDIHAHPQKDKIPREIVKYIANNDIDCLVIAGDLLEMGHKKVSMEELESALKRVLGGILRLDKNIRIYYATSTSSHDPKLDKTTKLTVHGKEIVIVPGILIIRSGEREYWISHGDYASRHGTVARIFNKLGGLFGGHMTTERILRRALNPPEDSWVICGHTHFPAVDHKRKIANTGSWHGKTGVKPSRTAILINDGHLELIRFG